MKLKIFFCVSLITLATLFTPAANAQTYSVIHTFQGGSDGAVPRAGVTLRGGNLFGATYLSTSDSGNGLVFQMMRVGNTWAYAPIYRFSGSDGANPNGRVVFGPDGHLYGATRKGGSNSYGTVFNLTPPLSICKTVYCPWTRKSIYDFNDPNFSNPSAGDLVWDQQGSIYGTTVTDQGISRNYQLTLLFNGWSAQVLWNYSNFRFGPEPDGGVIVDSNGNLFGATCCAQEFGASEVYELKNNGGTWTRTILYTFSGGADGKNPAGGLVLDSAGDLFGTTYDGGAGGGTVFELSPAGDQWTYKLVYSFFKSPAQACGPNRSLTFDAAGNLYGTTYCDGVNGYGNVFRLTNTGNGWTYTSLYDFQGVVDGGYPLSEVTIDTDGTLYGTTSYGGSQNCVKCGTVWQIKP